MLRLKWWRLQQSLTQAQAARRIGVGESTLAILETGRLRPTVRQLEILRRTFGNDTETLFDPIQERVEATP